MKNVASELGTVNTFDINQISWVTYWIKSFERFNARYWCSTATKKSSYDKLYTFLTTTVQIHLGRNNINWITDPIVYLAYLHYQKKLSNAWIYKELKTLHPYKERHDILGTLKIMLEWKTLKKEELERVKVNTPKELKNQRIEKERIRIKEFISDLIWFRKETRKIPSKEIDISHIQSITWDTEKEIEINKVIYLLSCILFFEEDEIPELLYGMRNEDNIAYNKMACELNNLLKEKWHQNLIKIDSKVISKIVKRYSIEVEQGNEKKDNKWKWPETFEKKVELSEKETNKLNELIKRAGEKSKKSVENVICDIYINKIDKLIYILECYWLIEVWIEKRFHKFLKDFKEEWYQNKEINLILNWLLERFWNNRLIDPKINWNNINKWLNK